MPSEKRVQAVGGGCRLCGGLASGTEGGWGSERSVVQWEEGEAVGYVVMLLHPSN